MIRRLAAFLTALVLAAVACGGDDVTPAAGGQTDAPTAAAAGGELVGVFAIDPGVCADAGVTAGSYFRMVQSGGNPADGPFVPNGDSPCGDQTWVPLEPGSDGGLATGRHQPFPDPVFDDAGNAVAAALTAPARWFAVDFAVGTNPVDPQTGIEVPPPTLSVSADGHLEGDLSALSAAWNGQFFNQGSPKPGGDLPGNTTPVIGDYDTAMGAYTLNWTSQIVGGPFDNFTGVWHLEGTFTPAG
ncbi:MAG: hypothetical protein KY469_08260 [Actinobacteria bacterium]|nr:hypothetical protein [Actinomycetota bacterium]